MGRSTFANRFVDRWPRALKTAKAAPVSEERPFRSRLQRDSQATVNRPSVSGVDEPAPIDRDIHRVMARLIDAIGPRAGSDCVA